MTNLAHIGRRMAVAGPAAFFGAEAGGLIVYFIGVALGIDLWVPRLAEPLTLSHVVGFAGGIAVAVIAGFAVLWWFNPHPRRVFLSAMLGLGLIAVATSLTFAVAWTTLLVLLCLLVMVGIPVVGVLVGASDDD